MDANPAPAGVSSRRPSRPSRHVSPGIRRPQTRSISRAIATKGQVSSSNPVNAVKRAVSTSKVTRKRLRGPRNKPTLPPLPVEPDDPNARTTGASNALSAAAEPINVAQKVEDNSRLAGNGGESPQLQPRQPSLPAEPETPQVRATGQCNNGPPTIAVANSPARTRGQGDTAEFYSRFNITDQNADEAYDDRVSLDKSERDRWFSKPFKYDASIYLSLALWGNLQVAVAQFVAQAFPRMCRWHLIGETTRARLLAITPQAPYFVEEGVFGGAEVFFTAWIWRILYDDLFSPDCSSKWAGESWVAFGILHRTIGSKNKAFPFQRSQANESSPTGDIVNKDNPVTLGFHHARHQLARILYMRQGPHTYRDRLVDMMLAEILPVTELLCHPENVVYQDEDGKQLSLAEVATPRPPRPSRSVSDNKKALAAVVDSAIEIHLNMISCKKNITVEIRDPATGKGYGFLPDKDLMDCIGQGRHTIKPLKPVNYVKIPLLRVWGVEEHPMEQKRGSRDISMPLIRSYHICETLQKMQVVVDDACPFPRESKVE
ncbi:hypothetical protein S7711_10689 [Stachybotrys chartarum IBT 7711]|uniref:Uncharacterized protein n=1 Tax=Stachybotrys chartarum (strain CBS 109288 / IBT 7711) TaxID=1280523 RepID=A0A084AUM8_STACB|nr:hypothetical protein S7711_10689 [Stachybotrys chartarum IBT 7711]